MEDHEGMVRQLQAGERKEEDEAEEGGEAKSLTDT